jgi:hypothetical protein
MATDDHTTAESKCPCGNGTISVTRTTPDHPWARASQTTYSAALNCPECCKTYAILGGQGDQMPGLVLKSAIDAHRGARVAHQSAEKSIRSSAPVERLCNELIARIDAAPSMAARYRLLQSFHLVHVTYGTYRKRPTSGTEAIRYVSPLTLVRLGIDHRLAEGDDLIFCIQAAKELSNLSTAESSLAPRPLKTGATWLVR